MAIIVLTTIYVLFRDSLPPRTPLKVARLISGLSIPGDVKVIEFKDQWNDFNGNGFSLIVLRLDDKSFDKIYREAKSIDYRELPINENIYGPLKNISENTKKGIYKVQIDDESSMSFEATLLSEDDNNIIVYFTVN